MADSQQWRDIRSLPIEHTFEATPQGEIRSVQWLALPRSMLPEGWTAPPTALAELGPFYFRRLAALFRGLFRVREAPDEVRFELAVVGLPLLCFATPTITRDGDGGTTCYPITGGIMVQPGAPTKGYLCMSLLVEDAGLRLGMEIREYYSRIQGSGTTRWLRRQLYARTQAAAHHFIARDFVRQLALAIHTGKFPRNNQ